MAKYRALNTNDGFCWYPGGNPIRCPHCGGLLWFPALTDDVFVRRSPMGASRPTRSNVHTTEHKGRGGCEQHVEWYVRAKAKAA